MSKTQTPEYATLMAYSRLKGLSLSSEEAKVHGMRISALCRDSGIEIRRVPDDRWGSVNAYPLSVVEPYFQEVRQGERQQYERRRERQEERTTERVTTHTTDLKALLAKLARDPMDWQQRLVVADCYEENGHDIWATRWRLSAEITRMGHIPSARYSGEAVSLAAAVCDTLGLKRHRMKLRIGATIRIARWDMSREKASKAAFEEGVDHVIKLAWGWREGGDNAMVVDYYLRGTIERCHVVPSDTIALKLKAGTVFATRYSSAIATVIVHPDIAWKFFQ